MPASVSTLTHHPQHRRARPQIAQLKEIRLPTIEAFVELMRKHAAVENERLYPWLARAAAR